MTIREICEKYHLTHVAMSKRFEIPLRTIEDWCSGRRTPPGYVVKMILEILGSGEAAN